MYRSTVRTLMALSFVLAACSAPPEGGSTLNFAAAFGWGGHADTDLTFAEFFGSDHTLTARFMPQYPRAYTGPVLAENGPGTFLVGQHTHTGNDPRLVMAIGSAQQTYEVALSAESWHHLAVVRAGDTFSLYLDGQHLTPDLTVSPGDANLPAGSATLRLARRTTDQTFHFRGRARIPQFYGLVDDVALFDRALGGSEIATLASGPPRLDESLLASPWNMAAAWTFDSATPSGGPLPPAFDRPVTLHSPADDDVFYEGVGELLPAQKVPASQARNDATDAKFLPPPFHRNTYHLPFQPGQAWEVWFGNNTLNSHYADGAFTWDFGLGSHEVDTGDEDADPSSCDQPLYAASSGVAKDVDDDNFDAEAKDQQNALRMRAAPDERFTYMHIRTDSASDAGLQDGDHVPSGQLVARVGTRETDGCHLHFGLSSETITIPLAFSDYEASDDGGQTWHYVERGVPEHGQWVRQVGSNSAPNVEIVTPSDGSSHGYGGLGITFEAIVSDAEDGEVCCGVRWTSDVDGFLGTGTESVLALSEGTHVVTARAVDTQGAAATDDITVTVGNSPPAVGIDVPSDGAELVRNTSHVFQATAGDVNEPLGNLCATATWTSTVAADPTLQGCAPEATFTSNGPRTLTVSVTDELGATASDSVEVTVVDPPPTGSPHVTILNPKEGNGLQPDTNYILEGTATDPDGTSPLTYEWFAAPYGGAAHGIGTGASLSWTPSDDVPFNCGGGQVDLRLEVTDQDGELGQDEIEVFIAYPPC